MKKQLYLFGLLFFPFFIQAQNVGIGTTTPTEKLEVKNPLRSTLKISAGGLADTTQLIFSNSGSTAGFYTDFSITSIRENGLFFSSQSDFPANNSANSLVITPGGNVGVGIVPTSKFHVNGNSLFTGTMDVNGNMKLQGLNLFEFGAGVAGKELNAGKIGYNAFGTNALAIVGAGTKSTNRAVYFFAEGGTTFTGPATILGNTNITGQLQVNGIPGTTGQVLTSNGTSNPTWVTPGLTHYAGELFGGGIIVAVWKIAGVEHGLIASLTNLSTGAAWSNVTAPAVGTNAYDGQANTTAIIAQPGHINSAAKLCNDFSSGGFTDWYLPAAWELYQCFIAAHIVNTIVGPANGFGFNTSSYWSSTEDDQTYAYIRGYYTLAPSSPKGVNTAVRAVRKF